MGRIDTTIGRIRNVQHGSTRAMRFKEVPATKRSLACRRKVYGVGVNDAQYLIELTVDGKRTTCPFYRKWSAMLERCYSKAQHNPAYKDCVVCNEWLTFSNFKAWMIAQPWKNRELDKDLKVPGNRVYSPGTCLFVPKRVNSLLLANDQRRGDLPLGVGLTKNGKIFAQVRTLEGHKHLGHFPSISLAAAAYTDEKVKQIQKFKSTYPDLAEALEGYASYLLEQL